MISADHFWLLAAALMVDALAGDPDRLWSQVSHPVALTGWLVGRGERVLNRRRFGVGGRRVAGAALVAVVVALASAVGFGLEWLFQTVPYGAAGTVIVAAVLLAGRSLHDHVAAVAAAFDGGIEAARAAVKKIVGRDVKRLDRAGVSRAAIESAAENFSDGVVAPGLWFLAFGLPGLFAYKAVNTADSMIGHRDRRHADFGWAAARLDDVVNWPAARLAGGLIALAAPFAGGSAMKSLRVMGREAGRHRSPNAGWPEAAMAAALGLALGGPRRYGELVVEEAHLNAGGRHDAGPDDIGRALRVYRGAGAAFFVGVALVAVALAL